MSIIIRGVRQRVRQPGPSAWKCGPSGFGLVLLALLGAPAPEVNAKALLGEPVVDRPSDQNDFSWCPAEALPYSGQFTADGPQVTFEIRVSNQTGPGWRAERIDNFIVVPLSDYNTHTHLPDSAFAAEIHCVDPAASYFHFHEVPPGNIVFLDPFDSTPDPRWSLTGGAYFDPTRSAPAELVSPADDSGGALGLGLETNPATQVTTSITLSGFSAGQDYVVTLWEYAAFPLGTDLTISVFGTEFFTAQPVPVVSSVSYGAAWVDYDGDGDDDVYACDFGTESNSLYRNDAGTLVFDTPPALNINERNNGSAWADYDNDGDLDAYVSAFGAANHLVRNDGGGVFVEVTAPPLDNGDFGTSVAWVDFDVDGDVDLFLANALSSNRLFRNDSGSFVDVTPAVFSGAHNTRAGSWADADNDGDPDVYLVSTNSPNKLLRNDGGGVFVDVTPAPLADAGTGSGATWIDYDNDGLLDLFLTKSTQPNRLFRSAGGMVFVDVSAASGLGDPGADAEGAWADYDNDGDPDLYLARGLGEANTLYRNDGASFSKHETGMVESTQSSQGAAWGDVDGDGDLDLFVTTITEDLFFRNETGNLNHWLRLHLVGTASNVSAIGARVRLVYGAGTQHREVSAGSGRESQNSLDVEFGLGSFAVAESIIVNWPSGLVTEIGGVASDQRITIVEGGAVTGVPENLRAESLQLHAITPNPFRIGTDIRFTLPAPGAVQLRAFDVSGRRVRRLASGWRVRGTHRIRWDGRNDLGVPVSPGIYFVELRIDGERRTRKGVRVSP